MSKLPAPTHERLRKALASGNLPEDPAEPGYNDVYDIYGELWESLAGAWERSGESPARRHVSALIDVWSAIPTDGLLVGVAVNQPEVVAAAIEAARFMKLKTCAELLARIHECIPGEVSSRSEPTSRHEWYDGGKKGRKLAAQLEELEGIAQDGEFGTELLEACFRRVLAEPAEFFERV